MTSGKMAASLEGKVALVTGASRGVGKGIAIQLAQNGAKVYMTARTLDPKPGSKGSLRETEIAIKEFGGACVAVRCDHTIDEDVENVFTRIDTENGGRLDILVNNVYSAVEAVTEQMEVKFWDQPTHMWDTVNRTGLRDHYLCSVHAARLMVPRKSGLIVNISSGAGLKYLFNCAYGIGKAACDRMAADCGHELRNENVAFVSVWPGPVTTETVNLVPSETRSVTDEAQASETTKINGSMRFTKFESTETPDFVGQCIVALARDRTILKKSGKIVLTCDLAREYGLSDVPGHAPADLRQVKGLLRQKGRTKLAKMVPPCLRVPKFALTLAGHKFY